MATHITKHILARKDCRLPLVMPREDGRNIPTYITIHETSTGLNKTPADKDAKHYIDLLEHPVGDPRCAYHFLCEDTKVWQFLPTWVRTAHSGSTEGNSSIGIERLVNVNIDFEQAIANQARLAASLMKMYNIPIEHVVPHKYWSGKECPSRLLAGMYGWDWDKFIQTVYYYFATGNIFTDIDEGVQWFCKLHKTRVFNKALVSFLLHIFF